MRVVEIETQDNQTRYVVVDEEGSLVIPVVRYLKYLDCIGSARNTLRSYAAALRLYWTSCHRSSSTGNRSPWIISLALSCGSNFPLALSRCFLLIRRNKPDPIGRSIIL